MSKKYSTPEMFQTLYNNPELVFKRKSDGLCLKVNETHWLFYEGGQSNYITFNDVWILNVDKKVTFMEAVEAYDNMKNVYCQFCGISYYKHTDYKHTGHNSYEFIDQNGQGLSSDKIKHGTWYIEAE